MKNSNASKKKGANFLNLHSKKIKTLFKVLAFQFFDLKKFKKYFSCAYFIHLKYLKVYLLRLTFLNSSTQLIK